VREDFALQPLSPYGVSKAVDELYGASFGQLFGLDIVALRYFNVFGPRQNPESEYAAVVPKFITRMLDGKPSVIYGSGRQSRDFVYVGNVVAANLKACAAAGRVAGVYNIASGQECSVLQLAEELRRIMNVDLTHEHAEARPGEIERSWADIGKAASVLGYIPEISFAEGLRKTAAWYTTHR
jgi:UDP-glucose 4-epimerase